MLNCKEYEKKALTYLLEMESEFGMECTPKLFSRDDNLQFRILRAYRNNDGGAIHFEWYSVPTELTL